MAKTVHFGHFLLKIKFYCKIVPKSPFWHDFFNKIDQDAPFRSLMINRRILRRFIIKNGPNGAFRSFFIKNKILL